NAIDAAVAVGFALAVTLPRAGNIGGGGFMLVYAAKTGKVICIDYREKAPKKAYRDMFLNKDGNVDLNLSRFHHLSAGVPGTVAGLAMALRKFGTISLSQALKPAIKLADEGFLLRHKFCSEIKNCAKRLKKWDASKKIFFKKDGSFYAAGDLFLQKDLAHTLKTIADRGINAFYQGEIAALILKDMQANGGFITAGDLKNYKPALRTPVKGNYRGYAVYSMYPPSSGGVHIIQMLNIIKGFDLPVLGHNSAATIHIMAEAMRRAYADRSKYLGDPDFVKVPVDKITSMAYARALRDKIDLNRTAQSRQITPGMIPFPESENTTHFSIVDKEGNAVANTYTINFSFGSGIVVPGAGFLLNNEMDDFSAKPGVPNAFGLIGGTANAIAANKRMLSSMSPTIVLKDGKPFLVTGSPGGSRIITATLQIILNVIDHKMNIQEAVNAPRIHHQWFPDEIRIEEGISLDTTNLLRKMGHRVSVKKTMGAASSILIDNKRAILYGAGDPRRQGLALGY
ncbi:gamma-glutamyltransferase, partial [Candidatus Riflebacteria bacterium]